MIGLQVKPDRRCPAARATIEHRGARHATTVQMRHGGRRVAIRAAGVEAIRTAWVAFYNDLAAFRRSVDGGDLNGDDTSGRRGIS